MLPIINENDTVSVDEIRFGDNDHLAALVTNLIQAPLLILLSVVGQLDVLGGDIGLQGIPRLGIPDLPMCRAVAAVCDGAAARPVIDGLLETGSIFGRADSFI